MIRAGWNSLLMRLWGKLMVVAEVEEEVAKAMELLMGAEWRSGVWPLRKGIWMFSIPNLGGILGLIHINLMTSILSNPLLLLPAS